MDHVTEWWSQIAEHFKDASHLVAFDLMIDLRMRSIIAGYVE